MSKEPNGVIKAWEATIRKTQAAKKRANSIFNSISVARVEDEDEDDENDRREMYHMEKILPNGDYYTGQWYDNFPNGYGKYLWTDGCMYVGEWYRGKTMGKGRFSWPSGATYEGEFKSGYMDGIGTYTGSNGDTYRGQWVMNLKHGHGVKSFANGDRYDGEWRRGMQEGNGRYQWKRGDHYIGDWKNGVICGKGALLWCNGDRYDGHWEGGAPKGNGTYKWKEWGFYVGNWSKDANEQNGSFYPSGSLMEGDLEWDPQDVYRVILSEFQVCPGEKVPVLPSQKKLAVWSSSKDGGERPRRPSVDGRASTGAVDSAGIWGGDEGGETLGLGVEGTLRGVPMRVPKVLKRQGETICRGHKNYELMLNLQLGIR